MWYGTKHLSSVKVFSWTTLMPSPVTTVQHIASTWQLIVLLRVWAQVTSWSNWVHPQKWPYIFFAIVMIVAESLTCCACSVCVCALYLEEVKKTLQTRYNSPFLSHSRIMIATPWDEKGHKTMRGSWKTVRSVLFKIGPAEKTQLLHIDMTFAWCNEFFSKMAG